MIAKAMSSVLDYHMVLIDGASMMEGIYGDSEKKLEGFFMEAQEHAPSVIFIDELDALASKREEGCGSLEKRLVAKLLTLMDGTKQNSDRDHQVIIIGATNRLDAVDGALRRPGRFEIEIYVGVPDEMGRKEIYKKERTR